MHKNEDDDIKIHISKAGYGYVGMTSFYQIKNNIIIIIIMIAIMIIIIAEYNDNNNSSRIIYGVRFSVHYSEALTMIIISQYVYTNALTKSASLHASFSWKRLHGDLNVCV